MTECTAPASKAWNGMATAESSAPPARGLSRPLRLICVAVGLVAGLLGLRQQRQVSVLRFVAKGQFAWGASTTDVPISAVSVVMKAHLSRSASTREELQKLVPFADTVPVQPVRDFVNAPRLERLQKVCRWRRCDFNEADPTHGLTALHIARFAGDDPLAQYLLDQGAKPVMDGAGRLPRNLSFARFISNSKRFAREAGRDDCDLPVVNYDGSAHARSETARLVGEGEPVLLRGALRAIAPELLDWEAGPFVEAHGDEPVRVGSVPYAAAFNLSTREMPLRDYYRDFVAGRSEDVPSYVFSKSSEVCGGGYEALTHLIEEAFPTPGLIVHPRKTGAADGMHFFLGRKGSGAPMHIHADAINAAVSGTKQWYVYTPGRTLYSRKPIKAWVEEDLPHLAEEDKPLICTQKPGDVIYVPLDWGHGVLNMEEDTFGFALEVLNIRDTLMNIAGTGK